MTTIPDPWTLIRFSPPEDEIDWLLSREFLLPLLKQQARSHLITRYHSIYGVLNEEGNIVYSRVDGTACTVPYMDVRDPKVVDHRSYVRNLFKAAEGPVVDETKFLVNLPKLGAKAGVTRQGDFHLVMQPKKQEEQEVSRIFEYRFLVPLFYDVVIMQEDEPPVEKSFLVDMFQYMLLQTPTISHKQLEVLTHSELGILLSPFFWNVWVHDVMEGAFK